MGDLATGESSGESYLAANEWIYFDIATRRVGRKFVITLSLSPREVLSTSLLILNFFRSNECLFFL